MPHTRQAGNYLCCQHKQRGAALMVMLVVMIIGSAAFLVGSLSRSALRIQQNQNSSQTLAHTKEEVMGNIMSGIGGQIPGNLLSPDMLSSGETPPYNYDGSFNGGCLDASQPGSAPTPGLPLISSGINMRCLGRLPWKAYSMSISSPSENDPPGAMPWYAVSANLVDPINVTFNSALLNANPSHLWLTVRDMKGNVLSNRVAIVIIVPGVALTGQSRPSSPNLGGPNQYLDSITVPAGCTAPCVTGTYSNYDLDDDFIMGDERRWIADPNNPANRVEDSSYQFNDKLIYITIDELMPLIEKRVGNEIKKALNTYYAAWGSFPFAASAFPPDPSTSTFTGQAATYNGLLPVGNIVTSVATLSWDTITPPHYYINGVDSGTCTYDTGGASNSRLRCGNSSFPYTTIPAGQTITFTGKLNGVGFGFWRPHNISATNEFRVRNSSGTSVLAASMFDNVIITNTLNADGSATITFSAQGKPGGTTVQRIEFRDIQRYTTPTIPNWLFSAVSGGGVTCVPSNDNCNNWHQVAYYAVSQGYAPGGNHTCTAPCLTVNGQGGGSSKQAVVVMTSGTLAGQTHPSDILANYLEGENATPADFIYQSNTRSSTFNDQVIIVAP